MCISKCRVYSNILSIPYLVRHDQNTSMYARGPWGGETLPHLLARPRAIMI